jgi:hypothetical protein
MKITIVPIDKIIGIDGEFLLNIQQDFSWIPQNVHAVQWYETWGEIEYTDGSPNERIEELGIYEQAVGTYNNEKQRVENEIISKLEAIEAARDYWEELRFLRNQKLSECDWTQILDVTLTEEQKIAWQTYRQVLRDLPANTEDPKPLVLDPTHPDWPISPE